MDHPLNITTNSLQREGAARSAAVGDKLSVPVVMTRSKPRDLDKVDQSETMRNGNFSRTPPTLVESSVEQPSEVNRSPKRGEPLRPLMGSGQTTILDTGDDNRSNRSSTAHERDYLLAITPARNPVRFTVHYPSRAAVDNPWGATVLRVLKAR